MKLSEKIQKILDSSITSYRISKITGVTVSSIGAMRRGERKVENMQLGIAEKLGQFYDEEMADMSMETIQIILSEAFKKIGVKPFIDVIDMGDGQDAVVVEIDLLGDDDPARFAVYVDEVETKNDVLQNLVEAMKDFDTYEDGESYPEEAGYYPDVFNDQNSNKQPVTAEYMPISKESSDYLCELANKLNRVD